MTNLHPPDSPTSTDTAKYAAENTHESADNTTENAAEMAKDATDF